MIATPHLKNELVLTMQREYYESKKIVATLQRLRLEVTEAGMVDPTTLQQAFAIWVHYNMAPRFCLLGKDLRLYAYRLEK